MQEDKNIVSTAEVIEAEVLDEEGRPIGQESSASAKPAHEQAGASFLAGFFALAFSVLMILVMAVVTVFIVLPLMLLGRLLGMQVKTFRR